MKNKAIAFALALVGGIFGLHQFYLNQTKKGLIYFLLCRTGIPWLFSLADMVMILSADEEEFQTNLVAETDGRQSFRNRLFQVQPLYNDETEIYTQCQHCGANDFYEDSCGYCGQEKA